MRWLYIDRTNPIRYAYEPWPFHLFVDRTAVDAIDLEMRENPYTKEQTEEYRAELRALTEQLRGCKQL